MDAWGPRGGMNNVGHVVFRRRGLSACLPFPSHFKTNEWCSRSQNNSMSQEIDRSLIEIVQNCGCATGAVEKAMKCHVQPTCITCTVLIKRPPPPYRMRGDRIPIEKRVPIKWKRAMRCGQGHHMVSKRIRIMLLIPEKFGTEEICIWKNRGSDEARCGVSKGVSLKIFRIDEVWLASIEPSKALGGNSIGIFRPPNRPPK